MFFRMILFSAWLASHSLHAQLTLSGQIEGAKAGASVSVNVPYDCYYYPQNSVPVLFDAKGHFSTRLTLTKAQIIFLDYAGKRLYLYAEPGRSVSLTAHTCRAGRGPCDLVGNSGLKMRSVNDWA
ncbi:MAG: hypothetical protein EOO39_26010 [Cytophagaceae bacterium]|nr:MAG: hypothetical protein EOO39_26010 [Cytophagaceae bacterium]